MNGTEYLRGNVSVDDNVVETMEGMLTWMLYDQHMTNFLLAPVSNAYVLHHDGNLTGPEIRRWGSGHKPVASSLLVTDHQGRTRPVNSSSSGLIGATLASIKLAKKSGYHLDRLRIGLLNHDRPEDFEKRLAVNAVIHHGFESLVKDHEDMAYKALSDHWSRDGQAWLNRSDKVIKEMVPKQVMHLFETYLTQLNWKTEGTPELNAAREATQHWGSW